MIYLASPYTHGLEAVRDFRYREIFKYAEFCMGKGETVFSPILYGHQFAQKDPGYIQSERWIEFNQHMMTTSNHMRVYQLAGWELSRGVTAEIEFCHAHMIPVEYAQPLEFYRESI